MSKCQLAFLGSAREVGRSSIFLNGADRVMLDCGLKIHSPTPYPLTPPEKPDYIVLSHAHLDHSGFTPVYYRNAAPETICTPPTAAMAEIIISDSARIMEKRGENPYGPPHIKKMEKNTSVVAYKKECEIGDSVLRFHQAGHIPGAAFVEIIANGKRIVYTGDFKLEETKTTFPAQLPPKNPDVLIIESTYSDREHPNRKELEIELKKQVESTLENGGTVLFPAFAIGRTQELIRIIRSFDKDVDLWIDGMGWKVSETLSHFSSYVKDFKKFRQDMETCKPIFRKSERKKVLKKPGIIIATAGMLQGGPALGYLLRLSPESRAIFTGYCVEETNGYNLLNKGYVEYDGVKIIPKASWSYLDFSAHAGRSELFKAVHDLSPGKVFCVHGDSCERFADELSLEGYDASAPALGDIVEI